MNQEESECRKLQNETLQIFKSLLFISGVVICVGLLWWAWHEYSPTEVCSRNGGEWDNIYVKCVEKGQTFWDKHIFPPEPCNCNCVCSEPEQSKKGGELV